MNRSSAPGLGQWLTVSIVVVVVLALLWKLFQYGQVRLFYPTGLHIAGIDVGGFTQDEAEQVLIDRYLNAPVVIYHGENRIELNPLQVEFQLDIEAMFSAADYQKAQQDYWAGFWGFLIGQPVEIEDVELVATHDQGALLDVLERIATSYDQPSQPPQPVPGSFSFQYGERGLETDVETSLSDVNSALYRATDREAFLTIVSTTPERPSINLLARLLVNNTQEFEQATGGVASIFIYDLENGDEITINANTPMSGMGLMRMFIALEAYRLIDGPVTVEQEQLISDALLAQEDTAANGLLAFVSGDDDPYAGADRVTATLQRLGLENSFIAAPYGQNVRPGDGVETPANSAETLSTAPTPAMQSTAADMGTFLSMLYYCAEENSGAIIAALEGDVTPEECGNLLGYLSENAIDSLIEQGVPGETRVAHRHGWIEDTHGDAGIVYTPSGSFVLVEVMYKPTWLEWEISSPLMANIARATYNFFNFDDPFLDNARSN